MTNEVLLIYTQLHRKFDFFPNRDLTQPSVTHCTDVCMNVESISLSV